LEYVPSAVEGRSIIFTTSNGTLALAATHAARLCLFAGFVNVGATITAACSASGGLSDFTILCAGTDRRVSLEDTVCAGRIVRGIRATYPEAQCGDGARLAELVERPYHAKMTALAKDAVHARALAAAGFAADVACCFAVDTVPVAVRYHDRQLQAYAVTAS
jgi:2-phosphosulfolactate phosphatase